MTLIRDRERVAKRAEQFVRETPRNMRRLAEPKAVAGPEHDKPTSSLDKDTAADVNPEVEHA